MRIEPSHHMRLDIANVQKNCSGYSLCGTDGMISSNREVELRLSDVTTPRSQQTEVDMLAYGTQRRDLRPRRRVIVGQRHVRRAWRSRNEQNLGRG
eukprot:55469-Eustigmatos_ZCMA.PRE.2